MSGREYNERKKACFKAFVDGIGADGRSAFDHMQEQAKKFTSDVYGDLDLDKYIYSLEMLLASLALDKLDDKKDYKKEYAKHIIEVKDLKFKMHQREEKLRAADKKLVDYNAIIDTQLKLIEDYKNTLLIKQKNMTQLEVDNDKLKRTIVKDQETLLARDMDNKAKAHTIKILRDNLDLSEAHGKAQEAQLAGLEIECSARGKMNAAQAIGMNTLNDKVAEREATILSLESAARDDAMAIDAKNVEIKDQEEQIEKLKAATEGLNRAYWGLGKISDELRVEISGLKLENEKIITAKNLELANLDDRWRLNLKTVVDDYEEEVEALTELSSSLNDSNNQLRKALIVWVQKFMERNEWVKNWTESWKKTYYELNKAEKDRDAWKGRAEKLKIDCEKISKELKVVQDKPGGYWFMINRGSEFVIPESFEKDPMEAMALLIAHKMELNRIKNELYRVDPYWKGKGLEDIWYKESYDSYRKLKDIVKQLDAKYEMMNVDAFNKMMTDGSVGMTEYVSIIPPSTKIEDEDRYKEVTLVYDGKNGEVSFVGGCQDLKLEINCQEIDLHKDMMPYTAKEVLESLKTNGIYSIDLPLISTPVITLEEFAKKSPLKEPTKHESNLTKIIKAHEAKLEEMEKLRLEITKNSIPVDCGDHYVVEVAEEKVSLHGDVTGYLPASGATGGLRIYDPDDTRKVEKVGRMDEPSCEYDRWCDPTTYKIPVATSKFVSTHYGAN